MINKTPNSPIITVNNLILDAGTIRDGMGSADTWTLAGNISVTDNGGGIEAGCTFNVDSKITGSGTLYLCDNGSGEAARTLYIKSGLNTYDGNVLLLGHTASRSRLTFTSGSLMNFTVLTSGNSNMITGTGTATFNGDFKFNLDGAGQNLGDSWTIASAASQTFGDTFTVKDFEDIGGNLWTKSIDETKWYQFSESTGTLDVVPEPATIVMILPGVLGMGLFWLRKRS